MQGNGKLRFERSAAIQRDVSPPLRDIKYRPPKKEKPHEKPMRAIPQAAQAVGAPQQDTAVQAAAAPLVAASNGLNLIGLGAGFVGPQGAFDVEVVPSDPDGAVGANQYVQWINIAFAVFNKTTGAVLLGPIPGNALWSGFGGPCETSNDGDPIVKFDRAAGRWLMTQFAITGGSTYYQCVAVSTSADATGSYNRYAFPFSTMIDYTKVGVWPDAYYATYNIFNGTAFQGAKVCAWDRAQMIAGGPATQQCFQLSPQYGGVLPADLDGASTAPPGAPNYLVGFSTGSLYLWKYHADFVNPANSTLTGPTTLPIAPFTRACANGPCIPQKGTTQRLDAISDRLMFRLAYRQFSDHESLVVNHTVAASGRAAIRWYEIRDPGGTPVVFQQGTYAPDNIHRWSGSMGIDKLGNIAIGYSASNGSMNPAIHYTGRAPTDPLGALQAESTIYEGTGSQLPVSGQSLARWGDYTVLSVDPVDDCTFWYTNQYLQTNGNFNWSTRVASFAFPSCLAAPPSQDFVLTQSPASSAVTRGASTAFVSGISPSGGFNGTVSFSVAGLPPGATASFSPPTVTGSGSSAMTVTAGPTTPLGSYVLTVTATSGSLSHSANATLLVYVPAVATLVKTDKTTQGTWKNVYGSNGYTIAGDATSYPAYAQVAFSGQSGYTWAGSTTDVRALEKASTTGRVAATWYSSSSYTIAVNLIDGAPHQVSLYCLDFDNFNRNQRIELFDAVTNTLVDTRTVSGFSAGHWLVWNVSGHVLIRVTNLGGINSAVSGLFFDPPAPSDFSLGITPTTQTTGQATTTNYTLTVTPSAGFGGTVNFSASGLPLGAGVSFSPTSVAGSGSSTMTAVVGPATPGGTYPLTITGTSGTLTRTATANLVVTAQVPAAAAFLKTDTTTQGTWKGVYGAQGYAIAGDATNYPPYALVTFTGQTPATWTASTTDVRALQKAAATDRIAATWATGTSYTIDVNMVDGQWHQVSLYNLDWDTTARAQTVDVLDPATGAVLDTRSVNSFNAGKWLSWNLAGRVILRVTRTGGINATVSGIFFDAQAPPDFGISATPASQNISQGSTADYTVAVSAISGFSGTVTLSASNLPPGSSATFTPATVVGGGTSTMRLTAGAATPYGSYNLTITGTSGTVTRSTTVGALVVVPIAASAAYLKTDTATQGSWKNVYGAQGYAIAGDATNYPAAYAQVTFAGQTLATWASTTTDVRALQKSAAADRIAATWTSGTSYSIDISLTDGLWHQVSLYNLDWDTTSRIQTIDVIDASNGAVLDSRSVSAFNGGKWLAWNLSGHVILRITRTSGLNAVAGGIFFDAQAPPDFGLAATPASQSVNRGSSVNYTVTVTPISGFTGTVNLAATGLPVGATATFNPPAVAGSGTSTLQISTGASTPSGGFSFTVTGTSGALTRSTTAALNVIVPIAAGASFLKTDTTTQGTWKGVYGAQGYALAADATNYPSYAQVTFTGNTTATWASTTTDVRALRKAATADRIAATWTSGTSYTIDVNLTDGLWHQVSLYNLDWDTPNRAQTIDVLDASTGAVLDTRGVAAFNGGKWLSWNVAGRVIFRITRTAGLNAVVSGLFFDTQAPPDFAISATPATQNINQGASGAYTVTVTPISGFTGAVNFSVSGLPAGASATFTPTSVPGSGTSTMQVTAGAATPTGTYPLTVTGASGTLTHSTAVSLFVAVPVSTAAAFIRTDTTTQGTWKTVYGSNGYAIAGDATNYPSYAQVAFTGQSLATWTSSTTDVRALQKSAASDRIAATWTSGSSYTIDVNLMDGAWHLVSLYNLDWDTTNRVQTIDILDAVSGAVLDTRSVSAFNGGKWLSWNLSGHVLIRVTRTGGINAVVSGIFFDPPAPPDFNISASPASQSVNRGSSTNYTVTVSPITGFTGTVNLSVSGLPAGASATFTPASVPGSGTSTMQVVLDNTTPAGSHTLTVTGTSGTLAHSTPVTMVVMVPVAASAAFVTTDTATQGSWKGVYGAAGYSIAGDATSYPAFAQVTFTGQSLATWTPSTLDVRALQKAAPTATDRIAATWTSGTSYSIEVNLTDGNPHNVALYNLDWDTTGRVQTIDILDASNGTLLDTRSVSAFNGGKWLVWTLTGRVTIRVTRTGGINAVVSGLFFNN
ncbi:MAG: beta strand repeat-containing protein [Bryobacteraceae bacterium]